jgi:DNA-directed RNA polymerase subunit RPC12/RpoP
VGGIKMSAREKIAYFRGLIEGQNAAENAGVSKFQEALLGALEAIVEELDDVASGQEDLREYIEDLDDEVEALADKVHEHDGCVCDDENSEDIFDEEEEYEPATCPECGKDFFYQPDAYDEDEDLLCPHCGKPFKQ